MPSLHLGAERRGYGTISGEGTTNRVFALALGAGLLTVALLFAALFFWSARVDVISEGREIRLVENGVRSQIREIEDSLTSVTQWDEAVAHIDGAFDHEWVSTNIGAFIDQSVKMQNAVVFAGSGDPLYAMSGGREVPTRSLTALTSAAIPLVRALREQEAARGALKPDPTGTKVISTPIRASTPQIIGGAPYLVTATLIQPDFGTVLPRGARAPVLVTAVRFDAPFAKLSAHYLLEQPQLIVGATALGPDLAHAALRTPSGATVATIVWTPQRPGRQLLSAALPMVTAATAVLGLGLLLAMGALRMNLRSLRHAMVDLVQARNAAQAANHAKSQFLANMSHEIRTPLNGILGMAQVLQRGDLAAEEQDRVAVIRQSGEALLAILDDVLDLSKIETGKLELEVAPFNLADMARGACAAFAALAEAKGLAFEVETADSARGVWRGDCSRLRQIFYNLASNAVKFTERGRVGVTIEAREADGAHRLILCVTDTGPGISADLQSGLFAKFVQADDAHTRRFGGAGLGLAIAQDLARLMGGEITLSSVVGEGSRFTLELPLEWIGPEPQVDDTQTPAATPVGSLRILAAEDNPTNQLVLKTVLQSLGLTAVIVENGREAVEAWDTGSFDLILMDIQMPEMDGISATRRIRELEAERGGHTPILALTANAMKHQVAEYIAAGLDAFLAKPLDIKKLCAALDELERPDDAEPQALIA
ncbi:ATP-binding protein [Phenylobacterium sp.]|uniref:ATP-binding protein n=1 Tax=Phenylobacterium sp. TaxID=1871053 RepID=UPI0027327DC3|nr:ATP-binding protein [Phenylobacterium sp.]MDP3659820.1 ATP-binding protein [Phenylobacterium sp.]